MSEPNRRVKGSSCDYLLAELIGQGQFGKVYKARVAGKPQVFAVKAIHRNKFLKHDKLRRLLEREMEVLSEFKHPHVIQLIELIVDKQEVYLVYEYCEGGTLQDRITIPEEQFYPIFLQIIDAMCQAQQHNIIHRDIKPANILFQHGKIKVADWGFSRLLESGETTSSFIGSPAYMAPEVLQGQQYSLKADVWSLGVVAYESLVGFCPWFSKSINSLSSQIAKKPLSFPKDMAISKKTQRILSRMLHRDPQCRPTFKQIKALLMVSPVTSPKANKLEGVSLSKAKRDNNEQKKIVSCVFFLELIQWSRKNIEESSSLLVFVRLIQQNLLQLKPHLTLHSEIRLVWEKELKVIQEMKKKLNQRLLLKKKYQGLYLCKTQMFKEEQECELNPEGQWECLVKDGIKLAIGQLECAYKENRQSQKQKEQILTEINLLLDLVLFREQPDEYLKTAFSAYSEQLLGSTSKALLKGINAKLLRINSIYYH